MFVRKNLFFLFVCLFVEKFLDQRDQKKSIHISTDGSFAKKASTLNQKFDKFFSVSVRYNRRAYCLL